MTEPHVARRRAPLHPQAAEVVAAREAWPATDIAAMRVRYLRSSIEFGLPTADVAAVEDVLVPRADGGAVPTRVFTPRDADATRGCIVWLHGGAWVVGELDALDPVAGALAEATGARVVAVEYRLAPEHPFPAALEDADAVVGWAGGEGAAALGHDPARVLVGGDSAGGNLAAVAVRRARDAGGAPPVRGQLLAYPVTDARMETASYGEPAPTITAEAMRMCWSLYLGDRPLTPEDPDLSPIAADLTGLPPALLVLAGHDVLYDEGLAYADALRAAGVDVEVVAYPELPHGFLDWSGAIEPGRDAVRRIGAFVRALLG